MKTHKDLCWTCFDRFNLVRDQRTSCVPSIQRGSPSQPVPLIFGMTCAGIGGIGKVSSPTRKPYSLMLPSQNWIHQCWGTLEDASGVSTFNLRQSTHFSTPCNCSTPFWSLKSLHLQKKEVQSHTGLYS